MFTYKKLDLVFSDAYLAEIILIHVNNLSLVYASELSVMVNHGFMVKVLK